MSGVHDLGPAVSILQFGIEMQVSRSRSALQGCGNRFVLLAGVLFLFD